MCPYHVCWRWVCSILYYTKQTFQDRFQGVSAICNRWNFWSYDDTTKSLELFLITLDSQLMGLTALKFLFTRISAAPIPSSVRNLQSLRKLTWFRSKLNNLHFFEPGSSQIHECFWKQFDWNCTGGVMLPRIELRRKPIAATLRWLLIST